MLAHPLDQPPDGPSTEAEAPICCLSGCRRRSSAVLDPGFASARRVTFPSRVLRGRSPCAPAVRGSPRLSPLPRSLPRRWVPTASAGRPVTRVALSLGVHGVLQGVTRSAGDASLRRTDLDLSPLDVAFAVCTPRACRACYQTRCAPLMNFHAPSEFLGGFARLESFAAPMKVCHARPSSPPGVARPFNVQGSCRPRSRVPLPKQRSPSSRG